MLRPILAIVFGATLCGCSTAESSYSASSGFTRAAPLAVIDTTDTGRAIESELFAQGFNVVSTAKATTAEPSFVARLVVRRSWRGVIAGTVPGTITLTISDSKSGAVVATANYDLGSMSYNNAHDAAKVLIDALSSEVR